MQYPVWAESAIKNPLQNGIQSRTTVYTFFSCSSFQNIQEHVLLGTAFSACYCLFEFLSCLKLAHNYKLNWPKRVTAVYCSLGHCFTPSEGRMYSAIVEQYSVLQKKLLTLPQSSSEKEMLVGATCVLRSASVSVHLCNPSLSCTRSMAPTRPPLPSSTPLPPSRASLTMRIVRID